MKSSIYCLIACFFFSVFFASCQQETIRPIGETVTIEKDITDFDGLVVSHDFKVYVTFSETEESVRLEVDGNVANRVVVEKEGSSLIVRLDNNVNLRGNVKLEAYITTSFLQYIRGKSDSQIVLENELNHPSVRVKLSEDSKFSGSILTDQLSVELSSDAEMDILNTVEAKTVDLELRSDSELRAGFVTERLDAELSGDSKIKITGSAQTAGIEARGDSEIQDFGFTVDKLIIELRSDSEAQLTVNESINIKASGDSKFEYRGNAVIESEELTGDSKIVKVN